MSEEMDKLLRRFENALFASAKDEYNEGASESGIRRRADASRATRAELVAAIEALEAPSHHPEAVKGIGDE